MVQLSAVEGGSVGYMAETYDGIFLLLLFFGSLFTGLLLFGWLTLMVLDAICDYGCMVEGGCYLLVDVCWKVEGIR